MTDSAPKQEPPYGLRMPPDLKARVKAAAEANNRSMNAEIVATLEEKYPAPRPIDFSTLHGVEAFLALSNEEKVARKDEVNAEAQRVIPRKNPFLILYEHKGKQIAYLDKKALDELIAERVEAMKADLRIDDLPYKPGSDGDNDDIL
jgi:hypothetical protein